MKTSKTHFYLENSPTDKDGYGLTACGRQGRDVGGLIEGFFKMTKSKQRCKTCNKVFKRDKMKKKNEPDKKDLIIAEHKEFERAVKKIIDEQKSYTLQMAYSALCGCYNKCVQAISGETT